MSILSRKAAVQFVCLFIFVSQFVCSLFRNFFFLVHPISCLAICSWQCSASSIFSSLLFRCQLLSSSSSFFFVEMLFFAWSSIVVFPFPFFFFLHHFHRFLLLRRRRQHSRYCHSNGFPAAKLGMLFLFSFLLLLPFLRFSISPSSHPVHFHLQLGSSWDLLSRMGETSQRFD